MPEYISTGEILLYSVTRFWPTWIGIGLLLVPALASAQMPISAVGMATNIS